MLGCIADDFTGATDLAVLLRRRGLNVALVTRIPNRFDTSAVDAVVLALKSRNIAPQAAIEMSIDAMRFLSVHGADKIYFKYCSTFDSTDRGNIGPVIDALMDASLEAVEDRLFALRGLARKHSCLPDDLATLAENLSARLARLDNGAREIAALAHAKAEAQTEYDAAATVLTQERTRAASQLDKAVHS